MLDDQDFRDDRADVTMASPAAHLLDELQLHGYRPLEEEGDPSPLPSPEAAELALATIFEAAAGLFAETRLEPDLPDLLWSLVNLFHRQTERMGRLLDDNEIAQRNSQAQQDGSEVRSVELERLTALGLSLIERRNAFEYFRDSAANLFAVETGSTWRPRTGSIVNHRALTSAMIDSRDFINARKVADTTVLVSAGHRIGFAGGTDYNDHTRIWDILDKTRTKHADMENSHGDDRHLLSGQGRLPPGRNQDPDPRYPGDL
ncbi:MAG: hypothetical protein INF16_08305 [Methylobacterium sp.]|nr:hypothetical protein [Methylobacterium sp.]MCA3646728.1 hypothetical protein [Methylobacterium sp.]MCA3651005.1 hypothetical protein [Methylobacterium sp.]MCA4922917.1 hypothetical protein [Methylobacterium sp.]